MLERATGVVVEFGDITLEGPIMTAEYTGFGSPKFTSADFARDEPELDNSAFNPTPVYARERQVKRGPNPLVLAIVPAVLVAGGVLTWAMMDRPKDELMTSTSAPPAAVSTPTPVAQAEPTPTMAPETPAAAPTPAKVSAPAPVRPAAKARVARAAPSATDSSADASATVPTSPIPYSPSAQTSAPAPTPLLTTPPPVVTPDPAPVTATPQPETVTPDPAPQAEVPPQG